MEIADDVTESEGNPSDDDEAFVRQHYHGFLSREPDASLRASVLRKVAEHA